MLIQMILIIAGAFMVINAVIMTFIANFTIGVIMELLIGIILLLWGIFRKRLLKATSFGIKRVLRIIIASGIGLMLALAAFFGIYGMADTVTYNEDAVIVLGCAVHGDVPSHPLAVRLNKAVEYHEKNPSAYIVVSGGKGMQENITEAECMRDYLVRKGVDESKIIMEDRATSTTENIRYSMDILNNYEQISEIALITTDFHIFRAKRLAKLNGLDVTTMHSVSHFFNAPPMFLREILAVSKMVVFGK